MTEQISFEMAEFANNPEPRCPCVLLLDVSSSMAGQPIDELNDGLQSFRYELLSDTLAMKRVEVAVVTFGSKVTLSEEFAGIEYFYPQPLVANGATAMGEAITTAIDIVDKRKKEYRQNGIAYYRPWIFMITDGTPTDKWQTAKHAIEQGEASKAFAFFAIGVQSADMETLGQLSVRAPLKLDGLKFAELFRWLSSSLRSVSQSCIGDEVSLPAPDGWTSL